MHEGRSAPNTDQANFQERYQRLVLGEACKVQFAILRKDPVEWDLCLPDAPVLGRVVGQASQRVA